MAKRGYKQTPEHIAKRTNWMKGRSFSSETIEKMRAAGQVKKFTLEHRNNIANAHRGKIRGKRSNEARENARSGLIKWISDHPEMRLETAEKFKKWRDSLTFEEYREWVNKTIKATNAAFNKPFEPNKLELRVQEYLNNEFPGEWLYNNGQFVLAGFVPDFININGKKELIEVFGDYWHRNSNPRQKIAIFARYGFRCVVIWEHEFNQNPHRLKELLQSNL